MIAAFINYIVYLIRLYLSSRYKAASPCHQHNFARRNRGLVTNGSQICLPKRTQEETNKQ